MNVSQMSVRTLVKRIEETKAARDAINRQLDLLQAEFLKKHQREQFEDNGQYVTASVRQDSETRYDAEVFRKGVPENVWRVIRREVVDKDKLKSAQALGLISTEAVKAFSTQAPKKPWVSITRARNKPKDWNPTV